MDIDGNCYPIILKSGNNSIKIEIDSSISEGRKPISEEIRQSNRNINQALSVLRG
jgi:hypothetical protein